MSIPYASFLILYLVGLATRTIYEMLKKAGRIHSGSKVLFAFIFAAMAALWIGWFAMCPFDPFKLALPDAARWIGLGAVILAWGLAIGTVMQLRGLEDIDHLITSGLFSQLRHPLYTAFIVWIPGWSVFHGAGLSLILGVLAIASTVYWARLEEEVMIARYGDIYREYRARTWF